MDSEELEAILYGNKEVVSNPIEKSVVYIPGVRDIIHITPRAFESEEEKRRRKREIAKRIAESPTPEIVRNIGTVLNWFDDIGDALNASFWGGKGALWLASKIGLKVATRAIPYLGWALLAKDVVDVVNFFGIGRKLFNRGKRERWRDQEINPFGKKAKVSRASKILQKVPGFGDILEIAQTTDYLFGVGISFGPIIGFVEDLFFGAAKGAEIKPSWEKGYNEIDAIIRGVESGAFMNSFGQEFSDIDHMAGLAAMGVGYDVYKDVLRGRFDLAVSIKNWDIPIYPRRVTDPISREVIKEIGFDPDQANRYPYPGEPEKLTAKEMISLISSKAPKCLGHWLKPLNRDMKGMVAGEMIDSIVENSFRVYEGEDIELYYGQDELGVFIQDILEERIKFPYEKSYDEQIEWVRNEGKKRGLEV